MRLALSIGLISGSLAAPAFGQAPPAALAPPAPAVVANPFPPATRDVSTIPLSASEELTAEKILSAPKFWASAEYLVLYTQNANTPSLIESIPNRFAVTGNTPAERNNAFPGSTDLKYHAMNGFRVSAGVRIQPDWGVDGSIFGTETLARWGFLSGNGTTGSDGVARPYTQAGTGTNVSLYSALPGQYSGYVTVNSNIQAQGADINLRKDGIRFFVDRSEWLAGFRYFELSEKLQINDRSVIAGTTFATQDEFQTRNQFYGGQVGIHSRIYGVRWSLDFVNKFAIGGVHQSVRALGSNSLITNGIEDRQDGGLYAREGNFGFYERDKFAVMGESQIIAGYHVTDSIRLHIGYTGSYISSVIRAPEVIDPTVNDSRVRFIAQPAASTATAPQFRWNRASDFFLQGLTFGATIGY